MWGGETERDEGMDTNSPKFIRLISFVVLLISAIAKIGYKAEPMLLLYGVAYSMAVKHLPESFVLRLPLAHIYLQMKTVFICRSDGVSASLFFWQTDDICAAKLFGHSI